MNTRKAQARYIWMAMGCVIALGLIMGGLGYCWILWEMGARFQ